MKHRVLYIPVENKEFSELNPLQVGEEVCRPLHTYGPAIREYYLIHYVKSGKGELVKNGEKMTVGPGQAFLICPGEVCTYSADPADPWHYIWIGFDGTLAGRFETLGAVFEVPGRLFEEMLTAENYSGCVNEYLTSKIFSLYAKLLSKSGTKKDYVAQVCNYIETNYSSHITVKSISETLGVERTYLSKLFRQKTRMSIGEYLMNIRFAHAEEFLKNGYMVYEVAAMCGYGDVSNFSRMYKKKKGVAPVDEKRISL